MRLLIAALALCPTLALAQISGPGQVTIAPAVLGGQGIMTVTTASQTVNTANVTTTPNSIAFPGSSTPLSSGVLRIKLQQGAAGTLTVCWRGGTCTATNGEVFAADEARIFAVPTFGTNPTTMFASTSVSVEVEW